MTLAKPTNFSKPQFSLCKMGVEFRAEEPDGMENVGFWPTAGSQESIVSQTELSILSSLAALVCTLSPNYCLLCLL